MIKVKIKKKGKKLQLIDKSVKTLSKQKVHAGYFAAQGRHLGGEYSYAGLAQALSIGVFPAQGIHRVPMPFLNNIGKITIAGMGRDPKVKAAFQAWGRKISRKGNPKVLLDAMGERAKRSSQQVFSNPAYFPQAPHNDSPLFDTGDFARHFTYKTTWTNSVRST